jgi:hypothetical protein
VEGEGYFESNLDYWLSAIELIKIINQNLTRNRCAARSTLF